MTIRMKINLVKSHGDYMRWRILSVPSKIFKGENIFGEYSVEQDEKGEFFLVLEGWKEKKNDEKYYSERLTEREKKFIGIARNNERVRQLMTVVDEMPFEN